MAPCFETRDVLQDRLLLGIEGIGSTQAATFAVGKQTKR